MLRKIGYVFMVLGLILPLTLMTAMVSRQFKEHSRYQTYTSSSKTDSKKISTYQDAVKTGETATVDPFAEKTDTVTSEEAAAFGDEIIGYLSIPSLDIKQPIYVGATEAHLNDGVANVVGTSLPGGGIGSRSVIGGHRSWYNDLRFFRLNEMKAGDPIYVEMQGEVITYIVKNVELIEASDWEKLLPSEDEDMLTLLTCDPLVPPFDYRLLVNATREVQIPQITQETDGSENTNQTEQAKKKIEKAISSNPYNLLFYLTVLGWGLCLWLLRRLYLLFKPRQLEQAQEQA